MIYAPLSTAVERLTSRWEEPPRRGAGSAARHHERDPHTDWIPRLHGKVDLVLGLQSVSGSGWTGSARRVQHRAGH
jgi:hypothetical protein